MKIIDSHAHVHDPKFDDDRDAVIQRALDDEMSHIITIGTNGKTSQQAIDLAEKYDCVYATIGLHPLHLFEASDCDPEEQFVEGFDHAKYLDLAKHEKVVAIGEVGLDYHHFDNGDDIDAIKKKQGEVFKKFIDICNEVDKPIVVHCWDGYDDLLQVLSEHPVNKRGVIHSYIGSWKNAQKFIALGYKIGLNGIVTYGESYEKLMHNIDLKDVLIETDCPYLPPRPLPREDRCEPRDARLVVQKIADVKNMSIDDVITRTTENTKQLFSL